MKNINEITEKLYSQERLEKDEFVFLLNEAEFSAALRKDLCEKAVGIRKQHFGNKVFTRGLIEFTNYCRNNCLYCGIRRDNRNVNRYRLTEEEILECCRQGAGYGYRTFVLQGGEDPYYTDEKMAGIVSRIRSEFPECAVTLSLGERSKESYRILKEAGADRYLLRHETASEYLYSQLHPSEMKLSDRIQCLYDLKDLGYQVGAGMMIGSPGQTVEMLAEDLCFLQELQPQMVGIGPFIPHSETPFADKKSGSIEMTLILLSVLRIMMPKVLLPATTALGTLDPLGREKGLAAGCNVVMPNLSPVKNRKDYELYDNKICTGEESAQCVSCLGRRVSSVGYELVSERGDHPDFGE